MIAPVKFEKSIAVSEIIATETATKAEKQIVENKSLFHDFVLILE